MRSVTASSLLVSLAILGVSATASAQSRTQPAGKLFFEGDIVAHALEGQQGPFCVLKSRYTRGEAVAWRMRVFLPDGTIADDSVLKSLVVELGSGEKIPLGYGPHGDPPTDYFWAESWEIPQSYPTGSLGYKILATMQDDSVVTWEPFTRPASQLWIMDGTPRMASQ